MTTALCAKGPEKLPHSVPKDPLGLVQGKVFSGFFCRRQAPHGLRGTTARKIYPTLGKP
jgi:hypothetical protein